MCTSPSDSFLLPILTFQYTANYTNPFASTHSLDANPFDDPPPQPSATEAARLEELRRREQDLERRETELNRKADHIRRHGRSNWPPCESVHLILLALTYPFSVFPLIYHSIKDEIPEASRPLITRLYQLWLVLFLTLIVNMIACIFILLGGSSDGGRDLGASIGCVSSVDLQFEVVNTMQLLVSHSNHFVPLVVPVCAVVL
jgi:hypothetical protein